MLPTGPVLDIGGMGAFFKAHFLKKKAPPEQLSFLTISNENIFFKTQVTRLGAIIAPNKGLE